MKKMILFCICISLCISTLTGCFSYYELEVYKPDLSRVPLLNASPDRSSFEYMGNTYVPFSIYDDYADRGLNYPQGAYVDIMFFMYCDDLFNVDYFSALIGTIPGTGLLKLGNVFGDLDMVYASPYDPEFNMLLSISTIPSRFDLYGHYYQLYVKEGYVPFSSYYDLPLAELYRMEESNPEASTYQPSGHENRFFFRYKMGDLSGKNLTINKIIEDEVFELRAETTEAWCKNRFICKIDGYDYISAFPYDICYDKDGIPYIRMKESETDDTRSEGTRHFYRVKEEYRDIFAWEYFGCEGHIDPNAKYDPDNEGTENPGGEGTENPGGEGTENLGGEGES